MPPTFLVVSYRSYDFPYDVETWNIAGLPHIGLTAHLIIRVGLTCGSCFSKMVCTMVFADICRTEETKGACKVMEV